MDLKANLQRAQLLTEQSRFKEAIAEVKNILQIDPENLEAIQILVRCYLAQEKFDEALEMADAAIQIAPTDSYNLYLKGVSYYNLFQYDKAIKSLDSAIAYNPLIAEFHAMKGAVLNEKAKYQQALEVSNQALALDAENLLALNQRSYSLRKLGKDDESHETIKEALHEDPENAFTHTNLGYAVLEKGDHKKAMEHFREALSLNPNLEFARQGMVYAMKANNWLYRQWLKYVFWISSMSAQKQFAILIGLFLLQRVMVSNKEHLEAFQPLPNILIVGYAVFALSSWVIEPISNLLLRMHSYGKYALSEKQIKASNYILIPIVMGILGLALYLLVDVVSVSNLGLYMGVYGLVFMIIISSYYNKTTRKGRGRAKNAGIAFGVVAGLVFLLNFIAIGLALNLFIVSTYGFLAFQFYINSQH